MCKAKTLQGFSLITSCMLSKWELLRRYIWGTSYEILEIAHFLSNNVLLYTCNLTSGTVISKGCTEYGSQYKSKPMWVWHPVSSSTFDFPIMLQHAGFAGICTSILLTVSLVSIRIYESMYSPFSNKWAWVNVVVLILCVLWHCLDCKTDFHPLRELSFSWAWNRER